MPSYHLGLSHIVLCLRVVLMCLIINLYYYFISLIFSSLFIVIVQYR